MTEIVFILDRSGSMSGLESDTIGGFNAMIEKQRAETEDDAVVSTVLFDHESIVLHDRVPLADIKPLTRKDYEVRGSTALLDAVGDAVKHIRNIHKYAREEDRPQKTLFIITTDGMENSSVKFSYEEIKETIERQKELGWEFIFLGANIDAAEVAEHIGIDARRAVNYHADHMGTAHVFGAVSRFISSSRRRRRFDSDPSRPNEALMSEEVDDTWREDIDKDFNDRK